MMYMYIFPSSYLASCRSFVCMVCILLYCHFIYSKQKGNNYVNRYICRRYVNSSADVHPFGPPVWLILIGLMECIL